MKKGDLVLVDYVGKVDGEIFDLSNEEKAKENDVYDEQRKYQPVPVLLGEKYVIEGFEEAVMGMEVGEEKEVDIPSEKAYGPRESDNVETYPEKEFKKQGVDVRQGEEIMIGRKRGKVVSKGSGRVRVDFNHPLSGKDLHYWIKVQEKVEDDEEKARHIFEYRLGHGEISFEDGKAVIEHKHEDEHGHSHKFPEEVKEAVREEILEYTDLDDVEFDEE